MKLLIFFSLLIAIANALAIQKYNKGIDEKIEGLPTPTSTQPTKVQQKRAKITEYHDFQNITIFKEGDTEWDQDWFESSWTVPEGNKVNSDGIIEVALTNNAGFSLQSKTLQSQYGYISFDFKLSVNDGKTRLNFISFDEGDYVNQGVFSYEGEWKHVEQEIKNHNKGTFISSIKRFAWQNYGNENDFILYLKNIVFRDIKVEISKYDKVIPFIDEDNCALNQRVDNISESDESLTFEKIDGKCTMVVKASLDEPVLMKLDKKISGGKLEITARSSSEDSLLSYYAYNTENKKVEEVDVALFLLGSEPLEFENVIFEEEEEYDAFKLVFLDDSDVVFYITKFNFHPIVTEEDGPSYDITRLEEPDVILDSDGLKWGEASWGLTTCNFQAINNAMECSFEGRQGDWPAFAFQTSNSYNAGTLVITMKVLNPDQNINILCYDITETYRGIYTFKASTEYAVYEIPIPSNEQNPTYKFAIQEASQQDNTYYIRSIVYYPPYIPLHGGSDGGGNNSSHNNNNDDEDENQGDDYGDEDNDGMKRMTITK